MKIIIFPKMRFPPSWQSPFWPLQILMFFCKISFLHVKKHWPCCHSRKLTNVGFSNFIQILGFFMFLKGEIFMLKNFKISLTFCENIRFKIEAFQKHWQGHHFCIVGQCKKSIFLISQFQILFVFDPVCFIVCHKPSQG